jgi:hypothetical protein
MCRHHHRCISKPTACAPANSGGWGCANAFRSPPSVAGGAPADAASSSWSSSSSTSSLSPSRLHASLPKVSWCDVEVDSAAAFILREDAGGLLTSPALLQRQQQQQQQQQRQHSPHHRQQQELPQAHAQSPDRCAGGSSSGGGGSSSGSASSSNSGSGSSVFQYIPSLQVFWRQNEQLRREYGITEPPARPISCTPAPLRSADEQRHVVVGGARALVVLALLQWTLMLQFRLWVMFFLLLSLLLLLLLLRCCGL